MKSGFDAFEAVIGLEVHAQLLTRTKLFCGCPASFGNEPNTNVCPVCLGLPGSLPALNREAAGKAVLLGLALDCSISRRSVFARKNYFYPDCPKNYQISMYEKPICSGGVFRLGEEGKTIGIERIHLEEDAGKLIHGDGGSSLVDFNRCGVPLLEIVTRPDLRSGRDAAEFLSGLRRLMRYLGICDGNMEEGSIRCDVNVSIRERGSSSLGTRTEIKNLNSMKAVEAGIEFEIERQAKLISSGGVVSQVTSCWDAGMRRLVPMRSKEEEQDYRYFPEPDLPPLLIDDMTICKAVLRLQELPDPRRRRFQEEYGLSPYDSAVLTAEKGVADYFEKAATVSRNPKTICNWVMREVLGEMKRTGIPAERFPVLPESLARLVELVEEGAVSGRAATEVFLEMSATGCTAEEGIKRLGLEQISSPETLAQYVDAVVLENPDVVERYRKGEIKLLAFLVGEVMKKSEGRADPRAAGEMLAARL
ncbi:MAG: Asp-tRNA(Asn)/Glu-tRNA(Gln) amidotransferase subunit GatB [Candidatus Krumholzibacteria bacterium]|nr:Asp-tRNA(Asn)/Glu-tRNA(Gln) amidotransferase subunit GatB [Candidatus Krumholzibacteria bacterium]